MPYHRQSDMIFYVQCISIISLHNYNKYQKQWVSTFEGIKRVLFTALH